MNFRRPFSIVLSFVAGAMLPVMHPSGAVVLYAQAPPQVLTVDRAATDTALSLGDNGLMTENWSLADASLSKRDTINTVENVFVQNPEVGQWTITVSADDVVEDGHVETSPAVDVDFALVVSGVTSKSACCLPPLGVCKMLTGGKCQALGGRFELCETCPIACEGTQGPQGP